MKPVAVRGGAIACKAVAIVTGGLGPGKPQEWPWASLNSMNLEPHFMNHGFHGFHG